MTRWTTAENDMLRSHSGRTSAADLAALMGRSRGAVRMRAIALSISLEVAGRRIADGKAKYSRATPEHLAKLAACRVDPAHIARRRAGILAAKAALRAWIPEGRAEEYRYLSRRKKMLAVEIRAMFEADAARDAAKAATAAAAIKATSDRAEAIDAFLTRHDRQLAAVQAGTATVVERVFMPDRPETFVPSQSSMA